MIDTTARLPPARRADTALRNFIVQHVNPLCHSLVYKHYHNMVDKNSRSPLKPRHVATQEFHNVLLDLFAETHGQVHQLSTLFLLLLAARKREGVLT